MLFLPFVLTGCAFITREVKLEQPERTSAVSQPTCIKVEGISDERTEPQKVGVTRNGFGMATADARTADDVAKWVGDYLRKAFPNGVADSCSEPIILTGKVKEAFVDEYWNLDGRLIVSIRLEQKNVVLLERDFEGKHKQISHAASNAEFSDTLREALSDFGKTAIPAIIAAVSKSASASL